MASPDDQTQTSFCDRLMLAADILDDQQMRQTAVGLLLRQAANRLEEASDTERKLRAVDRELDTLTDMGLNGDALGRKSDTMSDKTILPNDLVARTAEQLYGFDYTDPANPSWQTVNDRALEADDGDEWAQRVVGKYHGRAVVLLAALGIQQLNDEAVKREQILAQNRATEIATAVGVERRAQDNLRRFARDILEGGFEGASFDGADIQELGVKHGLLKEVTATEPCNGGECACAEVADFPATCYRFTEIMKPRTQQADDGPNVAAKAAAEGAALVLAAKREITDDMVSRLQDNLGGPNIGCSGHDDDEIRAALEAALNG